MQVGVLPEVELGMLNARMKNQSGAQQRWQHARSRWIGCGHLASVAVTIARSGQTKGMRRCQDFLIETCDGSAQTAVRAMGEFHVKSWKRRKGRERGEGREEGGGVSERGLIFIGVVYYVLSGCLVCVLKTSNVCSFVWKTSVNYDSVELYMGFEMNICVFEKGSFDL